MTKSSPSPQLISGVHLREFIERIENLECQKQELAEQIKEVFVEARDAGFVTPIVRQLIRLRKMKKEDLAEQEELLDIYRRALGD